MKIYFLQDHLRGGGTERQSIALTESLIANGLKAQLLIGRKGGALDALAEQRLGDHVSFMADRGITCHLKALRKIQTLSKNEPLLIICMGRWAHSMLGLMPRNRNVRVISTVRTSRPLPYLYRRCIRKSCHLIANSQWAANYTAECITENSMPPRSVVYNPLSRPELLEITETEQSKARNERKVSSEEKVLLNVARMDPGKGQADLLHMLAKLNKPEVKLWLLGDGPERTSLTELAAKLGINEKVHFAGFQENLRPYFASADLFICASSLDSLPNALIEAQAAGLPIVSYPSTGIPEIVNDGSTGILCKASSIEELSQRVSELISQPEERIRMGEAARENARQKFDRQSLNQQFSQLIAKHTL